MLSQLSMLIALLMSSGLISVGHGALSALVIQQGAKFGFSDTFLGLLVTATYVGFIAGNYLFRWLLPRISYIRTFAVCAALLTICALLLPIFPEKVAWVLLRIMHGLFFSTTVVICESWLNSTVDNQHRGTLHATMMTINYIGYGSSQYILLLGGDNPFQAFSLVAMFLVLSLAPICMTRFAEPQYGSGGAAATAMSIADAYRVAPLAYLSQLGNGLMTGATWLFVRYAEAVTETTSAASTLAVLFFGSGFILQMPIGWLSDRARDRRTIIAVIHILSAVLTALLFFGEHFPSDILLVIVLAFGMIWATAFSLNIAYGQDFAGKERAAEYAGRLFQPYAIGAIIGPLIAGFLMENLSAAWLFALVGIVSGLISVLCLTSRVIPHFVPVRQSSYQVTTAYTPTVSGELPEFNEYDIGPQLPEEHIPEESAVNQFVGPQPSTSEQPPKPGTTFVGPTLPEAETPPHNDNCNTL